MVDEDDRGFTDAVYVNWINSILTKVIVESKGVENDVVYEKAPVGIVWIGQRWWMSC